MPRVWAQKDIGIYSRYAFKTMVKFDNNANRHIWGTDESSLRSHDSLLCVSPYKIHADTTWAV
jgi:hypothetical protein